jgi:hypothetical protein
MSLSSGLGPPGAWGTASLVDVDEDVDAYKIPVGWVLFLSLSLSLSLWDIPMYSITM